MDAILYDTIVSFIAFATTRYALPNTILGNPIQLWPGFVLATCYAICTFFRKYMTRLYVKKYGKGK